LDPFHNHPIKVDARKARVSKGLKRLCTKGVQPWWIKERTPALLELETVKRHSKSLPDHPNVLAHALIEFLSDAVRGFRDEPVGELLWIVLALEETYEDSEGTPHALRDMNATERRVLAGKEFRGGRDRVGAHGIRLYHEPPALSRLTVVVLRKEVSVSGLLLPDGTFSKGPDAERVLLYLPGERVPEQGHYAACDIDGQPLGPEASCAEGGPFPPLREESSEYGWRLSDSVAS
jgi:hypothetical protein